MFTAGVKIQTSLRFITHIPHTCTLAYQALLHHYQGYLGEPAQKNEIALIREGLQRNQLTGNHRFVYEIESRIGMRIEKRGRGRPTENPAALGWAYLIFEILFQEKKRKNHLKLERAGGLPKEDAWYSNLLSRRRAARVSSL